MTRYFALPVLAVVLSLVGFRWLASPAPRLSDTPEIVVSLPAQEPEARHPDPAPIVTPEDLWEAPAPPVVVAAPAPKIEPATVAIEPPAPVVRTEVIEKTVYIPLQAPQQTVVYAPTTIYYPAAAPEPEPKRDTVENPVIVIVAPTQGRLPHPPAPRRPEAQQDAFFKSIPFQPPTPRGPRWNP